MKIKKKRLELNDIERNLKETNDEKTKCELRSKFKKTVDELNALRYPETQICPPNVMEWKRFYIKKLEDKNYVNAKSMGTEAIEVLQNFVKTNKILNFEDLLNGKIVGKIINMFLESTNIKKSKVKVIYLTHFYELINYLAIHSIVQTDRKI